MSCRIYCCADTCISGIIEINVIKYHSHVRRIRLQKSHNVHNAAAADVIIMIRMMRMMIHASLFTS